MKERFNTKYTVENFKTLHEQNTKVIKQANKNFPHKVIILGWHITVGKFTCFITEYVDGNNVHCEHKVIL